MITRSVETSHLMYARAAGFTFLFYIAAGMTSMGLGEQTPVTDLLSLLMSFSALLLGVTLYMLTREQGPALALFALTCRILEAVSTSDESAIFFAVGSTLFCWLLLQGRMIPRTLARLGILASVLLVVILPLQLAGLFGGTMAWTGAITWLVWLPMLVFEVTLALWLLIKGVARPESTIVSSRAISLP